MNDENAGTDHPQVRMPPPLIYLGGILIGYGLDQVIGRPLPLPEWIEAIAVTLAALAIGLIASTLLLFRRHRTTVLPHRAASTLVTSGPFRISRNPIYLGFSLLYLACVLSLASIGMLLVLLPVLWVINTHVIAEEEAFHARCFGAAWQEYCQQVRRWL